MTTDGSSAYDVVGIGFGPSNLSLAVALEDVDVAGSRPLSATFFESQPSFGWHRNILLPSAKMQVSFLKDLVTFRNPTSRFSSVSYLPSMGRLAQFVNNSDFYPTRVEFHNHLEWVAADFADSVAYGTRVTAITPWRGPDQGDPVDRFRIHVSAGSEPSGTTFVEACDVVMATGLVRKMPDGFVRDDHVWHSSEFLEKIRRCAAGLNHVAVVGAGQSAAAIARFCYDLAPNVMREDELLGDVDGFCVRDSRGRLRCGIYLQGGTEHAHGLSSSLLSNLAVRSGEIVESISRGWST